MPNEVRERTVYKQKTILQKTSRLKLKINRSLVRQRHCCELHVMQTLVTMFKTEKFTRIFAITINEIPCCKTRY